MIVRWLPHAINARFDQLDYIAADNPRAAIEQDLKIERQVQMLLDHPRMGRPGRVIGTRELVISGTPFILVYTESLGSIDIIRFLHSAQHWT